MNKFWDWMVAISVGSVALAGAVTVFAALILRMLAVPAAVVLIFYLLYVLAVQ